MTNIEANIEKTVNWLREMMESSKAKGLLVGVSGGIDSAVVAALIKKAAPDNSLGVILPIKSSKEDVEDAKRCIESCQIKSMNIDLTNELNLVLGKVVDELKLGGLYKEDYLRMTDANLRARLRMASLYAIANNLGYMVVGTDNAAEIYTGYYTKYGDGGVDLLPIANLLKSEVYEWAKVLNVPQSILDKSPSAGLWQGQTDESEMGTKYKYIDAVVQGREDQVPQEDLEIIKRLNKNSQHKRETPARGPKF